MTLILERTRMEPPPAGEFPARVLLPTQRATDDELMAMMTAKYNPPPDQLKAHPPAFFGARISSDDLDSYFTRMQEDSLKNYAFDAASGVMVLNSHDAKQFGFGRSLTGTFIESTPESGPVVMSEFFVPRGLKLNTVANDDMITAVEMGIITDISIGYFGATYICSIDGLDLFDWDCPHIPGYYYTDEKDDYGNKEGDGTLAFAWVAKARLAEYSLVYKGANPSAMIVKMQYMVDSGRLKQGELDMVGARYRLMTFGSATPWSPDIKPIRALSKEEVDAMKVKRSSPGTEDVEVEISDEEMAIIERVRAEPSIVNRLDQAPVTLEEATDAGLDQLLTDLGAPEGADARWVVAEFRSLYDLAGIGRAYRADLITDAIESGVRARGNAFKVDEYRGILESLTVDGIKRMRGDWEDEAKRVLGGGRRTTDGGEAKEESERLPDYVYAG